jgi:hypothetical protein
MTLHITFTVSGAGILHQAFRRFPGEAQSDDRVIALADDLTYGPINPPDPARRVDWMIKNLHVHATKWSWLTGSVQRFWAQALEFNTPTVWFSKRSAREFAGFLEWVDRAGERPYRVVDVSEAHVTSRTGAPRLLVSISQFHHDLLDIPALLDLAQPSNLLDRTEYRRSWQDLRRENAALRVLEDGRLVSADEAHFDPLLLSFAQPHWIKAHRIVGQAMAEGPDDTAMPVDSVYLNGRVAALVKAGKLEARGDVRNELESEVRLPG